MNPSRGTSPVEQETGASVSLKIVAGPHEGEQRCFRSPSRLVVGRRRDAHWRLDKDPYSARDQFQIEANPPACRLLDSGSSNGTTVNGSRVENVLLKDGDRIECGDTVFLVTISVGSEPSDTTTLDVPAEKRIDPSAPPTLFPRQIAEFELTRELARGGMGVVYHAFQRPSGREAAVKTILPAADVKTEAVQRFLREASILARLRHRRIVEYFGVGLHDAELYFAMEYLQVIDFSQFLDRQQSAKRIRSACGAICRVLEALQYAHELDVVHGDVKPSNVLVYPADAGLQVKLADFGLARNYASAGLTFIRYDNCGLPAPAFAAPEQKKDAHHAKPSCDIYSTAATLYFWLSNQRPLDPLDSGAPLLREPLPLAERAPNLPKDLSRVVDRSLAIDPTNRFASAEHMRRALLKFTAK